MGKIDLGYVGMLPWTDLFSYFTFPPNANIEVKGGYKKYEGKCFCKCIIKCKSDTTVTFPTPLNESDVEYTINNKIITGFNGVINLSKNDIFIIDSVYVFK